MLEHRNVNHQTGTARSESGFTLLELVITLAILSVLVGMAVPLMRHNMKRQREEELRANLQKLRDAIDNFQRFYNQVGLGRIPVLLEQDCIDPKHNFWPRKLECLTKGLPIPNTVNEKKYFLREIPPDPMIKCNPKDTPEDCWSFRSSRQKPEETSWDGEHIYDVFSKSEETALNGKKYKSW